MIKTNKLSRSYSLGLQLRKRIYLFCQSYGGALFLIRRPLVVFLNTLLDLDHQEIFSNRPHQQFAKKYRDISGFSQFTTSPQDL